MGEYLASVEGRARQPPNAASPTPATLSPAWHAFATWTAAFFILLGLWWSVAPIGATICDHCARSWLWGGLHMSGWFLFGGGVALAIYAGDHPSRPRAPKTAPREPGVY